MSKRILLLLVLMMALGGGLLTQLTLSQSTPAATVEVTLEVTAESTAEVVQEVELFLPEVIAAYPHDSTSFTQGLLIHEGLFYESAGRYGQSNLRQVDPKTGEVLKSVPVTENYFAEGLALVNDQLIQITWREQDALVYDLATFEQTGTFKYTGEGWGLCYDGEWLYMSDGSPFITRRDPLTFESIEQITVTIEGQQVNMLNELECVDDTIYANIWQTDYIVRIDKNTGNITGIINAAGLLTVEEKMAGADVLNGIAYDSEKEVFYITGKLWPKLFEVKFVPFESEQ